MFEDRVDAGQQLAQRLTEYAGRPDVIVLGVPRGGVPVAFEIAQALHAPLDILLVRKLGAPGQRELAMGAIASGGVRIMNEEVVRDLAVSEEQIAAAVAEQEAELQRREQLYRGVRPGISVHGKTVILVDDGIATGSSMFAAISALRTLQPKKIVVAVPVAPLHTYHQIKRVADDVVCALTPEGFFGISEFYGSFPQIEDAEVSALLARSAEESRALRKPEKRGVA
ncbi:MAG: phosphoribosyltransferase [Acidobacteriia bacterium]|nr:phosphoribosyltransferase [Terriglobia bacterium]